MFTELAPLGWDCIPNKLHSGGGGKHFSYCMLLALLLNILVKHCSLCTMGNESCDGIVLMVLLAVRVWCRGDWFWYPPLRSSRLIWLAHDAWSMCKELNLFLLLHFLAVPTFVLCHVCSCTCLRRTTFCCIVSLGCGLCFDGSLSWGCGQEPHIARDKAHTLVLYFL